ncbi:Cytochrome P450 [Mycena venus]|uniref:Cytochrome P450 n=1 Tax=Mycena venus TaxID=2733690 RepID=A0A8H6YJ70_9AGAR|nr:Cytochrome P450 [Mycena venus]
MLQVPEPRGDVVFVAYLAFATVFFHFKKGQDSIWNCPTALCQWIACSLVPLALVVAYRLSPFHPLAKFPGPLLSRITKFWLAYVVYTGKRHLEIAKLHDQYGTFVRTGPNTLSINSHEAIRTIYATSTSMDKSNAYRPGRFFGGGLFFIRRKDMHAERRRIWAPAFSPSSLNTASMTISRRSRQLAAHLTKLETQTIDLSSYIRRWSYDVMGDLTFGKSSRIELMSDGDENGVVSSGQKATVLFEVLGEIPMIFDLMCYLPNICMQEIHVLRKLANDLLATRKQVQGPEPDICTHLLHVDSGSAENLSDEELENDVLFAIQAGSDTTSGVLTLLLYYILADRQVYKKLSAELDLNFRHVIEDNELSVLFQLPYMGAVVQEALRLGTPFPGLPRVVPPDGSVICSRFIPAGTIVGVPAYAQQVSPENFWPHPLEFMPQRWLPGGLGPGSVLNKSAVMCFSSGPFGCLGKTLAIRELYIATAQLLLAFDLELDTSFSHDKFKAGIQNMRSTLFEYPLLITARQRGG